MKKLYFLLLLGILLSLTGCTSYTELNEIGIISAIGIDVEDGSYLVSSSIILPEKEEGKSQYQIEVINTNGKTISDAIHNITVQSSKKHELSHLAYLFISENAIEKLDDILNFFLQNKESRNNFPVILAKDITPSTLLEKCENVESIQNLLNTNQKEEGTTLSISLEDIVKMRLKSNDLVLPVITLENNQITSHFLATIHEGISYLSKEESKSYLYLINKIDQTFLNTTIENKTISISVLENYTSIRTNKNHITIEIDSTIETTSNLSSNIIKKAYEKKLEEELKHLLEKEKEENSDFLHLKSLLYQNDPNYYNHNKDTILKTFTYEINFQTDVMEDNKKTKGGDILGKN